MRLQQQFAVRIPSAANILEVNGERLPLANCSPLANCRAPFLFLPKGEHLVRFRQGERSVRVSIADSWFTTQTEMKQFFRADRETGILTEELLGRSARAMDVHRAPFLLNLMGASYVQRGQWPAAERKFRRALEVNMAYSPAHLNLAVCFLQRKDREAAEREWRLAEAFNLQNVFGLATAIHQLGMQHGFRPLAGEESLELGSYQSPEPMSVEDERIVAIMQGLGRYAVRAEDRGKIQSNLGLHFAETGRCELAMGYFREALESLRAAGPERFALASHVLTLMEQTCRRHRFDEAEEYASMKKAVTP